MRITEEQQEILESLVCERLSRNPANMRKRTGGRVLFHE